MEPLNRIVRHELDDIRKSNHSQDVSISGLSAFAGVAPAYLCKILKGKKRAGVGILVRLACALNVSPDRAADILHAAGHDISEDWSPACKEYRAAIGAASLEEVNAHLESAGCYISGRYRRQ